MNPHRLLAATLLSAALLSGCAPPTSVIMNEDKSAVQLRSYQQRAFDTADKEQTMRSVIATLQDLSFVVDKADLTLGTVSATKLSGYQLRMTVTVRPRGTTQMLVRANAQYGQTAVADPKPYQDFFTALEKSMFLTAQQVD